MKKTLAIVASLALTLLSTATFAQDSQLFNHLSAGISLGLDGIGAEIAVPATPYLQIRAGYSIAPIPYNTTPAKLGIEANNVEIDGKPANLNNMPLSFSYQKGGRAKLLLDIFPSKKGSFRITAGVYGGAGSLIKAKADMTGILGQEDWGTLAILFNDVSLSTDKKGFAYADLATPIIMPYLGIGVGRAVNPAKRVSVGFDFGLLYTGGIKAQTYDYVGQPENKPAIVPITSEDTVNGGEKMDNGVIDILGKIPVYPVLKLNLFFSLF